MRAGAAFRGGRVHGFSHGSSQTEVLSQIDLSYTVIIDDLLGLAVGEHRAVVNNVRPVADSPRVSHIVIGNDPPDAACLQELDYLLYFQDGNRVDACEW